MLPGIPVSTHRGYAAFPARELERLGFEVREEGGRTILRWEDGGPQVEIRLESPLFEWDGGGVHLADVPYREAGAVFLPVQFLVDVLPWKLPRAFRYETGSWVLDMLPGTGAPGGRSPQPSAGIAGVAAAPAPARLPPPDPTRVVIIDAGHGGRDPGTVGPRGTREKEVALGIARILAEELRGDENLRIYLTRDGDTLVPLWKRGELATDWKGERYGIFVSIHANALPNAPGTRGFETYFLSEARTEHERRVAALENAVVELEGEEDGPPEQHQDMSFILSELRNLDTQHWSALLADYIQRDLAKIHPGPNRGVKQAPLAVITNALMPAVLVEVGFLSNRDEETLLRQREFQEDAAAAVANAIRAFFGRYPPGPDGSTGRSSP